MDWVLSRPQIHNMFASLGVQEADGYHIFKNCNDTLEKILDNIRNEDKQLRTYRRSISIGKNISKDLIPLLIHTTEDKTIELLIEILLNLSIPLECLLSLDITAKTDFGRHIIFELNMLLHSCKAAFTDRKVTKVLIDCFKKNIENRCNNVIRTDQCNNISNCLLMLRNILHIPEMIVSSSSNGGTSPSLQNQVLWNMFSQSIDKILIKLMTIPEAHYWAMTMVQVIPLLYRDQHVTTLHKLLNLWLESSVSDSSEDNESNTSPPDRGSDDSSPMLTSDPTSDSSDTGGSGKSNDDSKQEKKDWQNNPGNVDGQEFVHPGSVVKSVTATRKSNKSQKETSEGKDSAKNDSSDTSSSNSISNSDTTNKVKNTTTSENSDCGYVTQIENQGSISTSSNEDELPAKKPVHQKPHGHKQRVTTKSRTGYTLQEKKRKKLVKRGKSNIINVQGLLHKTPTNEDISNVLKEFTVDFLLKGYNSLVHTVHTHILTNADIKFDSSHFFWLITYFVKFSTQIELDYEHVSSVLSFDMISYLTSQGVYLCEQCELSIKLDTCDLKSNTRRLHLVVTAIREIVQAIEMYQKLSHLSDNDREVLAQLQIKMGQTEELRSLFVLLLKHYNPKYHRKQYLQDLVVTNHLLILFLDRVMRQPEYKGHYAITEHFKQFATSEIMYQYGLLLEDYESNGQFVNDCIFTLMHHVGGELGSQNCLFQPKILKTFTEIRKSDFEISDDWSDLVGFVINTFVKKPTIIQNVDTKNTEDDKFVTSVPMSSDEANNDKNNRNKLTNIGYAAKDKPDKWTDEELSELNWNYMLCKNNTDIIGNIVTLYQNAGIEKTKGSVIRKLYKQKIINKTDYDSYMKEHSDCPKPSQLTKEREHEIYKFCEQLTNDGKSKYLGWVQKVLLDICNVKIHIEKKALDIKNVTADNNNILNFVLFKKKLGEAPLTSPVAYHNLLLRRSIPLVPWNCEQAASCKDLKFLQLVHKLGFQMPVDTGHVFICIPWNWSAAHIYNMASKILPIDISTLPFTLADIEESRTASSMPASMDTCPGAKQTVSGKDEKDNIVLDGVKNSNWLELVKQSKECKMISTSLKNQVVVDSVVKKEPEPFYMSSDPMSSTVNIFTNEFTADDNLSDCPSSISETASVASDLTRMYVSDEEDKFDKQSVSVRDDSSDADRAPPKRPRVS